MKKIRKLLTVFLLCISLTIPQVSICATEVDGIAEIGEFEGGEQNEGGVPDEGKEPTESSETVEGEEPVGSEGNDKDKELDENGETLVDEEGNLEVVEEPEELEDTIWQSIAPIDVYSGFSDEPASGAHGSGSYQLNEVPDDYRFYTEYYVEAMVGKSITTADILRRTTIEVYAKAGEVILFGSSVANSEIDENNVWTRSVTDKDIVITKPNGVDKITKDVLLPDVSHPNGVGYIANPTQEKNGPMVNHTDSVDMTGKYYTPLTYEVTESGVYTFEFHSVKGYNDGSVATPKLAKDPKWQQGTTTVAAWDVTVIGKGEGEKWEVKEGRAWADYLALSTGDANDKKSDLDVHVLTHDGYVYEVNFDKAVPFGFIFFANNTGFMTPIKDDSGNIVSKRPIYHSFYDSTNDLDHMSDGENIILHKPNETDTETEETYKIFFNAPSKDLNGIADKKGVTMKTSPDSTVTLTNLKFTGIGENIARAGHGGYFTFESTGEAMVTITLDLRKAISESESTMDSYEGSGIVEITAPAVAGLNSFYWDGKDTEGITLPAGIYGNGNVVLATEIKRGELHFPVIDMEGLYGGLQVERKNGTGLEAEESRFDLYYNNNPLVYGNIDGKDYKRVTASGYDILSDGTKSYKYGDPTYFYSDQKTITTLVKDTKDYLARKFFDKPYVELTDNYKAIIDAEFGKEQDTFHFEAVDSRTTSMKFKNSKFVGGGDRSGIDAWTYYAQKVTPEVISFAILDNANRGVIRGQIFYDTNIDSQYNKDDGDHFLQHMKVRLIDGAGNPLVHKESLPCFDETGHFIYNSDGTVKHEEKDVEYVTETDSSGYYRFTGVPYEPGANTTYYVQVLLSDVQSEVMRYACTTSGVVKEKFVTTGGDCFLIGTIDTDEYGSDGDNIIAVEDPSKIYGHKYNRATDTNETIFDPANAQSVTFSDEGTIVENGICVAEFKKIGYSSTVPAGNLKDYNVVKVWGENSRGEGTHPISDGLIVELWVWNDSKVVEENPLELSRRTGALMDTQVLNDENHWTYTWEKLDDRLQYYVLEYYTKKKPNGEIIYNDKHEPRKVLIGGTMPIFSDESSIPVKGIYGFQTNLGDYPEIIPDPDDPSKTRIPIQKFSAEAPNIHASSITDKEKLESIDNNARQYDVTYKLSISGNTNVIALTNSQKFDDRTYYVWLDHETVLPDLIAQTFVEGDVKKDHAVELHKDKEITQGEYTIKGLSVSSVDAAESDNAEGNATHAFRLREDGTNALFTPTNHGNYKTGTGTRTYRVKYVVDGGRNPVSVIPNGNGELVLVDNEDIKVELPGSGYTVYSWYMTIHVYDVQPDGVIEYDPNGGAVTLQEALMPNEELHWTLTRQSEDTNSVSYNSISYTSDDKRTSGLLKNDIYRLPLYKAAENPHMGSCVDLVGIAYAGSTTVDDVSKLKFADTYESRYGTIHNDKDGEATAQGSGGYAKISLNTLRNTRINRIQDHANYAGVTFTPGKAPVPDDSPTPDDTFTSDAASNLDIGEGAGVDNPDDDVFYYKIIVFSEDNTYQYSNYEDIDASEGVVMYTHFTMRPKKVDPDDPDDPDDPTPDDPTPDDPTPDDPTPDDPTPDDPTPDDPTPDDPTPDDPTPDDPTPDDPTPDDPTPDDKPDGKPNSYPDGTPYGDNDGHPNENQPDGPTTKIIIVQMEDATQPPIFVIRSGELGDTITKTKVNGPKTNDDSLIYLWVWLDCIGIGLIIIGLFIYKRRYARKILT